MPARATAVVPRGTLVLRFVLVPLAYVLACLAAGLTIAVALFGPPGDIDAARRLAAWAAMAAVSAGTFALVPWLLAVLASETRGWRSFPLWLASGGGLGIAAHVLTEFTGDPDRALLRLSATVAAGLAGGLVYWLVAGRRAGAGYMRPAGDPATS